MSEKAKVLVVAGLIALVGVLLVVRGNPIIGVVLVLLAAGGAFLLLRMAGEDEEEFFEPAEKRSRPSTKTERRTERDQDSGLSTWEPPEDDGLVAWEPEESEGLATWDAEESEGLSTWEPEEGEGLTAWEPEAGDGLTAWEPAEAEYEEDEEDTFSALLDDSFEVEEVDEEEQAEVERAGSLFSVASPIKEEVESDDDIMAASQATELSVPAGAGDNTELAKLLAKVQSRLAAYE